MTPREFAERELKFMLGWRYEATPYIDDIVRACERAVEAALKERI